MVSQVNAAFHIVKNDIDQANVSQLIRVQQEEIQDFIRPLKEDVQKSATSGIFKSLKSNTSDLMSRF